MVSIDSIMHKPIVTAESDEFVDVAARRMREAGVGAVVLVENDAVTGIFTERDLLTSVVAEGLSPDSTRVGDVATSGRSRRTSRNSSNARASTSSCRAAWIRTTTWVVRTVAEIATAPRAIRAMTAVR
ncbi:MAG: CBS domain-containing protein [Deltaproteobacteria bacterium]|nr:CBS domain-containing protein [Deltaproteobacteria bacterium]